MYLSYIIYISLVLGYIIMTNSSIPKKHPIDFIYDPNDEAAGELPYLDLPKTADELKSMQPLVPWIILGVVQIYKDGAYPVP